MSTTTTKTTATTTIPTRAGTVSPPEQLTADRVTKSLLGYGVIAGPIFVVSSVTQGLLREGFDFSRHPWSALSLGDAGWIQVVTFLVSGLSTVAAAIGLRRALATGVGATWAPRLLAVFGLSLVVAGLFPIDPMGGFPADLPQATGISGHAMVHLLSGAIGFPCLAAALLVLARRLSREGFGRLATACRIIAPLFLVGFFGMASGGLGAAGVPAFVIAVVTVLGLLSIVSVHRYRQMPDTACR
ncbi:DUF998 domain-containing protein [Pseudonocardia sp. TRM90224]|uniref:DUF998 domain-containing protein n=1 Tax=Pseudonocardia sp. TRM90224 TaxID=2812678 RepID=UPI001E6578E4|nr:DUF998 domain-containing protein [Pseudonocardia sp. TRM90224]